MAHLILDVKTMFGLQNLIAKTSSGNTLKMKALSKCYLGNKEQREMFLVVSRSNVHFGFEHPFFASPIGRASRIARRKVGPLENNLPATV